MGSILVAEKVVKEMEVKRREKKNPGSLAKRVMPEQHAPPSTQSFPLNDNIPAPPRGSNGASGVMHCHAYAAIFGVTSIQCGVAWIYAVKISGASSNHRRSE